MLRSLCFRNFLSFGPAGGEILLRRLNVVIGPNGSGKSNLLEGLGLLRAAPGALMAAVREGGPVRDWLWKGDVRQTIASLELTTEADGQAASLPALRYRLDFTESGHRFEIVDELIADVEVSGEGASLQFYYRYENDHPVLSVREPGSGYRGTPKSLRRADVDSERSILAQRRDPDLYPELTALADALANIRIYRDWTFGRFAPPRMPQPTDLATRWLDEKAANLGLVLNRVRRSREARERFMELFRAIHDGADDFDVAIEGGLVQVLVREGTRSIPASRLSDGMLRYLSLLAVLCDHAPPPLICLDEPELGLHPDVINHVADALRAAAERTQIIVTTHSPVLVDAFTDDPESVVICEKEHGATQLRRLDATALRPWLERYRLGSLWSSGEIGGNRW